jgi:hypothetical protein
VRQHDGAVSAQFKGLHQREFHQFPVTALIHDEDGGRIGSERMERLFKQAPLAAA